MCYLNKQEVLVMKQLIFQILDKVLLLGVIAAVVVSIYVIYLLIKFLKK